LNYRKRSVGRHTICMVPDIEAHFEAHFVTRCIRSTPRKPQNATFGYPAALVSLTGSRDDVLRTGECQRTHSILS